jgi:hypothetical protein
VKSAHDLSAIPSGRPSPLAEAAWFSLWGLKIQARLKHLLWKIAWDILPSRANISRFVVQAAEEAWVCPFCKGPLETLTHIFLECSLASFIWRNSPWPSIIVGFSNKPIVDWITAIIFPAQSLAIPVDDVNKFQLFAAITLDNIWRARNNFNSLWGGSCFVQNIFSGFLFFGATQHGLERCSCSFSLDSS